MNHSERNRSDVEGSKSAEESKRIVAKILSKYGFFHIRCLTQMLPGFVMNGIIALSPVFLNMVPNHFCRLAPDFNNVSNVIVFKKESELKRKYGPYYKSEL